LVQSYGSTTWRRVHFREKQAYMQGKTRQITSWAN
jgi:hypothetical protein